jgi:putative heme-binding domain-containing protein
MRRACILTLTWAVAGIWIGRPPTACAQPAQRVQWIWHREDDPNQPAPAGTRYFRRVLPIKGLVEPPVDEGVLDIAATGPFTLWVNGVQVGAGTEPRHVYTFDVRKALVRNMNALAVEVKHGKGKAGLMVRLAYVPNGQSKLALVSDGAWSSSATAAEGWRKASFQQLGWQPVRVLGPLGPAGPVPELTWDDRFTVPAGFRVEQAVRVPDSDKTFSLVNMTFDDKGRLLVSREGGPVLVCTDPDKDGVLQTVRPYCTLVRNCQGMCWVKDALLLVGDGPKGTGLYRVRDTLGKDQADEVTALHIFPRVKVPNYGVQGGMSEHGPHAILHGPDDWLYLVIGNHAWANPDKLASNSPLTRWPHGQMGPDQGKPNTTEDVLLPRLNDGRGHASNLLAPGGTIWRLDHQGQNMSLVAAGFRNEFDAAFSPAGELFTFDSDMEWDENLPWYRAVRVCHCPPGADFVWRTGAANTPDYYIDSLPPIYETGRGSPVGLEFYDHTAFPEKYRGTYFMADWAIGVIFAAHLERDGATYKARVERFCTGAPMNVTDTVVGPDGALYFVMGGRGTQGGVYRIVYKGEGSSTAQKKLSTFDLLIDAPQPLAAWSRARQARLLAVLEKEVADSGHAVPFRHRLGHDAAALACNPVANPAKRIRALDFLQRYYEPGRTALLSTLAHDMVAEVRAHATWLLGVNGSKEARATLLAALKDEDALVRRRACEALIRAGVEPPIDALWPLLGDRDRFVRTAARLVLQRIDPRKWTERLGKESDDQTAWQGIVALCLTNKAAPHAEALFGRLRGAPGRDAQGLLDYLRTVQLALIHVPARPIWVRGIATHCEALFPHKDWRVNRELAILLSDFQREGQLDHPIQGQLYQALLDSKGDRQQQIHYFYCMRLLKEGWTAEEKQGLAAWYNGTQTWGGGHSFTPFLENIFRETLQAYTVADRRQLLERAQEQPLPALVLATRLQFDRQPELVPALKGLASRLSDPKTVHRGMELRQAVGDALFMTALAHPTPDSWPAFVGGLTSKNPLVLAESLRALRKLSDIKPKAEEAGPYRALLLATASMKNPADRWEAVELLRQWNGRSFGADRAKADEELRLWERWYSQTFPKEPPLPHAGPAKAGQSKYKLAELLKVLDQAAAEGKGDLARGRAAYTKASCIKCHKHGKEGEGIGPDLTSLAKRFKRADILEAILEPSKVISDQYRSTTIITTSGQQITGLAAVQGDAVTVVLSDASKVTLKREDIESQVASLISVMPEQLLDPLTLQEIIDLFAFLEAEPKEP